MKTGGLGAAIVMISAAVVIGAETVTDDSLGVTFPERIGTLDLQGRHQFEKPGIGYSLRYGNQHLFKADIYVYDNDLADIGDGTDSKRVAEEFASVLSVFSIMEKMGKYKDVKHLDKGTTAHPRGSLQFLWSRCQYRQSAEEGAAPTGLCVSETYLSAKSGKFIKVRLTLKEEEFSGRRAEIDGFIKHLGRILGSPQPAGDDIDWANVKSDTVLKAIAIFESDPGGANAPGAMSLIVKYAEASPSVLVTIDAGYLPWNERKPETKKGEVLLAAYIAGNIQVQLKNRVKRDHPEDGLLFMCRIYSSLRMKNQIDSIRELDEWSKLDRVGIRNLIPKIKQKDSPSGKRE